MKSSLPPRRKAEILEAVAAGLDVRAVLREEGVGGDELATILREAAASLRGEQAPGRGTRVEIFIDGASRGNPGPSALGVVLRDPRGRIVAEEGRFLGTGTNNEAEYKALIRGLEKAAELGASSLHIRSDSELVVRQLEGKYKVREPRLQDLYLKAKGLLEGFGSVRIEHVPREENRRADALANKALDEYINKR